MAKKDIESRKKELQEELKATRDLAAVQAQIVKDAQTAKALSNEAISLKDKLLTRLQSEESITGQINAVQEAIDGMLKEQIERGDEVNQHYIDQLDRLKEQLEVNKEIALAEQERKNLNEAGKGILKDLLGINSDIEAAVVSGGMKVLFLNKAFENVSKNVSRMVDGVKEGVTQLGLSVGESMHLQANIEMASFSMTGFLYGSEAVASAAKAITAEYGNVNAATTDLIKGVTEVSVLTGDATSALKLTEAFESAGVPADEVADTIKDISKEAGVSATMAVKGLEGQMSRLVGASEEELELIIKGNAELQKRGMTMSEIEGLANNMLDIETSMRNEAKARLMLGRDIGANEMRSLSARLMTTTDAKERAKIEKEMADLLLQQAGTSEEFNNLSIAQQDAMAQAYGMTREELATKIQTAEKQKEMTDKYGEYADEVQRAKDLGVMVLSGAKSLVIEMVKVAAKAAVMNVMMGKDSGIGNFFSAGIEGAKSLGKGLMSPIKSLGSLKDKAKDMFKGKKPTEMIPDTKDMSKTVTDGGQAAGGGGMKDKFKDMAEGLKAMGDGKVFAGIGAVALAGPAFIVALPSIPFLLFMGLTPLKMLKDNFTGLSEGLQAMSKAAVGALVMALVGPALALGLLAIPFLAFMSIPSIGPIMQANFTALSAGLAAFGNPGTAVFVLIGIGLMALLGAAMIPFAYALSLLSPLLEAFGNIVVGVMSAIPPIIQAIADGFVTMLGAITPETVAGLLLLGPALLSASIGMLAFSAALLVGGIMSFFGGGIVDDIVRLGTVGPGVASAGEGLALVAENIGVITTSMSGLGDLVSPLYALAGGLGAFAVAAGMGSLFGGGIIDQIKELSEVGPGVEEAGKGLAEVATRIAVISGAMAGLGSLVSPLYALAGGLGAFAVAAGMGSLFGGGIVDTISELSGLGPGLNLTSTSLNNITSTFGSLSSEMDVLSESMKKMVESSNGLWSIAGSLVGIAGGLTAISFAGLLAMPTFAALSGLAAIAPVLTGLGEFFGYGGSGESETTSGGEAETTTTDNSNKELLQEIKGLRADINGQPIVLNIDGKAVSRIQRVGRQQANNRGSYTSL